MVILLVLISIVSCNEPKISNVIQNVDDLLKIEKIENDIYFINYTNNSTKDIFIPAVNPTLPSLRVEYFDSSEWVLDTANSNIAKARFKVMPGQKVLLKQHLIKKEGMKYRLSLTIEELYTELIFKTTLDI